jgi:hypothetical protein
VFFCADTFYYEKPKQYYFMQNRIGNSTKSLGAASWGILVAIAAVLTMVALTMFMQNNLTTISLTLISGALTALAILALSQVIRKAFTS